MGSCVDQPSSRHIPFSYPVASFSWGSAPRELNRADGHSDAVSSSSSSSVELDARREAHAQAATPELHCLNPVGESMEGLEEQGRHCADGSASSISSTQSDIELQHSAPVDDSVTALPPGLGLRKSGSENDLSGTLRQRSFVIPPHSALSDQGKTQETTSQEDPEAKLRLVEQSHEKFLHARQDPQARWQLAFEMTKLLGRGSGQKNAVMLSPEHWLEAQHPSHRSHLKPYFTHWKQSDTKESFFYWLDKGEGKKLDLPERPREQLESTSVRYCGPEIMLLEVCVHQGLLKYTIGKRLVHTPNDEPEPNGKLITATSGVPGEKPHKNKWIYVLDLHNRMYINKKQAGEFHHSSFTRGGPVKAAGSILVEQGVIKQITAWSGHYRPTESDFDEAISYLESQGIDMSKVDKFLTKDKPGSKMGKKSKEAEEHHPVLCIPRFLHRLSAPPGSEEVHSRQKTNDAKAESQYRGIKVRPTADAGKGSSNNEKQQAEQQLQPLECPPEQAGVSCPSIPRLVKQLEGLAFFSRQ